MSLIKKMASLCLLMGGLWASAGVLADELPDLGGTPTVQGKVEKDLVLNGDAKCTHCHEESDAPALLAIGKTKHGTRADLRTPSCTSCHGESKSHLSFRGKGDAPKPDFTFSKKSKIPAAESNAACSACHKGGQHINWPTSIHANSGVACNSCHNVHAQRDKVLVKATQPEVCFTCHKEQRVLVNKPSHHPVLEGKVVCSDCHNAHGSNGPKLMKRDTIPDTCYTCHMEKRGPFIRKHEPAEDCTICHNPHGTSADNLLKTRPPFLCQQCHEPSSHQSGIPGFGNAGVVGGGQGNTSGNRGITQARSCLNCHTQIHGSNNPTNVGNERTFRR